MVLHSSGNAQRSWQLEMVSSPGRDLCAPKCLPQTINYTDLPWAPQESWFVNGLYPFVLWLLQWVPNFRLLMIRTASTCASPGKSANAFLFFSVSLQIFFKGPWSFVISSNQLTKAVIWKQRFDCVWHCFLQSCVFAFFQFGRKRNPSEENRERRKVWEK